MRYHYRWPRRLFMKFFVLAAYNAYIIFRIFHMFVDEFCLQLVGNYRTAVDPAKPGPSSPTSFVCRAWDNTTSNIPGRNRQQPLRGLLRQVQQVPEETPGHRIRKHAPQAEEDHVLVFHMPQVPLSPCWQHMLE